MRLPTIGKIALSFLTVVFVTLCSAQSGTYYKKDMYAELTRAPQNAIDRRNPFENDPNAVLAGGKIYEARCSECHGSTAEGARKGPSLRAAEVQQSTAGTLFWVLTNGVVRRGMPVWSKLPEPQRWQVVSYIKSLTPASK